MIYLYFILCWSDLTKREYGAQWKLVFYHNSIKGMFFSSKTEALNCNTTEKFSILRELDDRYQIEGLFEFLLEYPKHLGFNRWVQKNSPAIEAEPSTAKNITGYKPISISWPGRHWGGLSLSSSVYTLIDGSIGSSNYWFSIGSFSNYENFNTFPGPAYSMTEYYPVSECYLWVRIPDATHQLNIIRKKLFFQILISHVLMV